jgi:lactoylglutathione lyase
MSSEPNVQQAIPFFMVSNIQASLRFYVDGLGFKRTNQWIVNGAIRWCWLEIGNAALMLQEFRPESSLSAAKLGQGISVCFQCRDAIAIYNEALASGLQPRTPFVGNHMWVTVLNDPDGYKLDFESPTTVPEETVYSDDMELSTPAQK